MNKIEEQKEMFGLIVGYISLLDHQTNSNSGIQRIIPFHHIKELMVHQFGSEKELEETLINLDKEKIINLAILAMSEYVRTYLTQKKAEIPETPKAHR